MEFHGSAPRVRGEFTTEFKVDGGPVHTFFELTEEHLPEDFMSQLAAVRGDGSNRISMSADFGKKEFGNGFSASATVSINCGATDVEVGAAANLASRWSIYFAKQHFEMAEQEYMGLMATRGGIR